MPPEDAKEYSWKWITGSELLSKRPCELCHVLLTCDGTESYITVYDGENVNGRVVMIVRALGNRSTTIELHHHAYCRRGLYIHFPGNTDHVTGVFLQWLERPQGIGYST